MFICNIYIYICVYTYIWHFLICKLYGWMFGGWPGQALARHGLAWLRVASPGLAWRGVAWLGEAKQYQAWPGQVSVGFSSPWPGQVSSCQVEKGYK